MSDDLIQVVLEQFKWLVLEGFSCEVLPYENISFIKKVLYKKEDTISIVFICDNRENILDFGIYIKTPKNNYYISEYIGKRILINFNSDGKQIKYVRIFDFTGSVLTEEEFQYQKRAIIEKPRTNKKKLISLYSLLIRTALKQIDYICNLKTGRD